MINNPKSRKNIRLLVSVFVVICILVIFNSYNLYRVTLKKTRTEKFNEIKAISELKAKEIADFYNDEIEDANYISQDEILKNNIIEYIKNPAKKNKTIISKQLHQLLKEHKYDKIVIINSEFKGLITTSENNDILIDSVITKTININKDSAKAFSTDLYYCDYSSKIHLDFIAPVIDNNIVKAYIIFSHDPFQNLYNVVQSWPIPSNTAEIEMYKIDDDSIVILNQLRHKDITPLKFKLPFSENYNVKARNVPNIVKDYRDVNVLSYNTSISGTKWNILSKIDTSEIFKEIYTKLIYISIISLIIILLSGAIIIWIYNNQQKNIYRKLLQTEQELFKTQTEYYTTLRSIGDAVISTDNNGHIQFINPIAQKITGWAEDEAKGKYIEDVFKIINEETLEKVENPCLRIIKQGIIIGLANHTLLINKKGELIPIADSGAPIKNLEGKITGVVIVFRDQTKERLQQKLLNTQLKLFEYAHSHNLDELLTKTLDELENLTNSKIGFYHFVSHDQQTIELQSWSTRTKKDYCNINLIKEHQYKIEIAGVWTDCIKTKTPLIHNDYNSVKNKKGLPEGHAALIRELVVPVIKNNLIVAILGIGNKPTEYTQQDVEMVNLIANVAWEIIEKKRSEELAAENSRRFNTMIDNLNGVVYRCKNDKEWTMEYISAGIESLSGYKASDFINNKVRSYNSIIHPDDQQMVWDEIQKFIIIKKPYILKYRITDSDNQIKYVWERGQGVFKNGELSALEGFITDITEFVNANNELIKAKEKAEESDRLKSAFLANMSHEIRTPMNGIMGFIELLRDPNLPNEKQEQYLNILKNSSTRLYNTINDIIEISKIEAGQIKTSITEFDLKEVMDHLYSFFKVEAELKNLYFKMTNFFDNTPFYIFSDKTKIESILTNLIKNSIKYTSKGGIEIGIKYINNNIEFYVKDTGIGIPKESYHKIFERFERIDNNTSKAYEGSGLGLAIAKAYAELLGGKIWVESEINSGSTFYFSIPFTPVFKHLELNFSEDEKIFLPPSNQTILIVEDDDVSFTYLEEILTDYNYKLMRATRGDEAVEIIRNNAEINLILMDIKIPGINGYEATRQIRLFNKKIPIIAQTAYALEDDHKKAIEAGCDDYISKPIKKTDLLKLISKFFDKN
jgi:PAS domain S-box-containing protein